MQWPYLATASPHLASELLPLIFRTGHRTCGRCEALLTGLGLCSCRLCLVSDNPRSEVPCRDQQVSHLNRPTGQVIQNLHMEQGATKHLNLCLTKKKHAKIKTTKFILAQRGQKVCFMNLLPSVSQTTRVIAWNRRTKKRTPNIKISCPQELLCETIWCQSLQQKKPNKPLFCMQLKSVHSEAWILIWPTSFLHSWFLGKCWIRLFS